MKGKPLLITTGALAVLAVGLVLTQVGRDTTEDPAGRGSPQGLASTGSSERQPLEKAGRPDPRISTPQTLRMSVLDSHERPIAGASIMWSGLDRDWIQTEHEWPDLDWDRLALNSIQGTTDEQGKVSLELPPTPRVRDIVWVTHPGYLSIGLAAEFGPTSRLPQTIRLNESPTLGVRVIGAPGLAQAGVEVHHLAECTEEALRDLDAPNRSARRAFRRTAAADAKGRAVFFPTSGEQRLWAECGALVSAPWVGRTPADVELELLPTFFIGGVLTWDSTLIPSIDAFIHCYCIRGVDREQITGARVRVDGRFGDVRVPISRCDTYLVELEGRSIETQYAQVVDPAQGERRLLTFSAKPGTILKVRVLDTDSTSVSGANISAQWMEGPAWRRMDRRTNAEGIVELTGIPPAAVWIRTRADGFVPKLLPQLETDKHDGSELVVRLERAGVVEGQCLLAGQPARDFTVHFWTAHPSDGGKHEVRGSSDGRFRIGEAAPGELVLLASGATSLQSPQVRVRVGLERPAEALLELPAPIEVLGRVVDGLTGEPVVTARVVLEITTGTASLRPWKEATRVDGGGVFAMSGLVPGENLIRVYAEGYGARALFVRAPGEERFDAGTIGLHRQGSLEVRFAGVPEQNFRGIRVDLQGVELRPFLHVPSSGVVKFDGLMPGSYIVRIVFEDNSTRFLYTHVAPGRNVVLPTRIEGEGLEVQVEAASREIEDRLYELHVTFAAKDGFDGEENYPIRRGRNVRVRTLDTKRLYLEAYDREGVSLGLGRFDLTGIPGEVVKLRVDGSSHVLRIVDRKRNPIAGARVAVLSSEFDMAWARQSSTDGDGICVLDGVTFDKIGISLRHPDHGVTPVRIVELPRDAKEPIELVLDAQQTLQVQVLDHDARLPGIELFATDEARYEDGLGQMTSDAAGLATWPAVAPGTYEVSVVHPGVWPDKARVVVNPSSEPIPFQVRRLGNVDFRVTTTLGNAVTGARFELHSVERDQSVADWIEQGAIPALAHGLVTDERGQLVVRGLPNGDFRYRAVLTNGAVLEGTVTVPPASTLDVPLRVD